MADTPIESVLVDNVAVNKGSFRSYANTRSRVRMADAAEVNASDLTGVLGIEIGGKRYDFDSSDTTSADDGVNVILDSEGHRFIVVDGDQDVALSDKRATVRAATTADITIATALNNGDTLDGVTLATDDLVLVKDQNAPEENGIYVVGVTPARDAAFDTFDEVAGVLVAVIEGSSNAGTLWLCNVNPGGTIETTALPFMQVEVADGAPGAPGSSDVVGTSTSSVAIGTGSKGFTVVEADRGWGVGARLRISSDAAPTVDYMEGVVTAYSGTSLTVDVDLVAGSGTHADWTINLAGEQGSTGATGSTGSTGSTGATGPQGATPAITQTYSTTTTDSDPGSGIFRFNNATIASVSAAYLDNNEAGGNSIASLLDTFDDSTATVKGFLIFRGLATSTAFAVFQVTGSVVDGTGYRKLTLTHVASGGTWNNGEAFAISFSRTGDTGPGNVGLQTLWLPATAFRRRATSGADPYFYDSGANDVSIEAWALDSAVQEYIHSVPVGMPKGWDEGTVTFIPYWTNLAGLTTENVVFSCAGRAASDDDPIDGAFGTAQTSNDTWHAQGDLHIGPESSAVTITSVAENDMVIFEVSRVVGSDNLTGDALFLGMKLMVTYNAGNDS